MLLTPMANKIFSDKYFIKSPPELSGGFFIYGDRRIADYPQRV
jgi:hypothetical protein